MAGGRTQQPKNCIVHQPKNCPRRHANESQARRNTRPLSTERFMSGSVNAPASDGNHSGLRSHLRSPRIDAIIRLEFPPADNTPREIRGRAGFSSSGSPIFSL